jgi:hypothetical protein
MSKKEIQAHTGLTKRYRPKKEIQAQKRDTKRWNFTSS